ncbi:hypothetical protein CERZMDRAFT_38221 [Cercospora zeae-maydis SCOH1-5]|uniref:Uncharacterized protein n=1 Tax=Cercospora zeae-maydis SCOH1-5 TaxID=717836 RepID=A0A6A6FL14_9PEZI|nr:hypothetical protein CERZMDRAFT_38221 [Cercospora zeae-maydis SCOH1-5]
MQVQPFREQNPVPHISDVPWYNKTFLILEQSSRRALTHTEHGLRVISMEYDGPNPRNTWLCVHRNNYMGFMNKHSRRFLGHDGGEGRSRVHAIVGKMGDWESFIPRLLPDGGYQILSPFWHSHMRLVVVADRDGGVERAEHGDTAWVFEEV